MGQFQIPLEVLPKAWAGLFCVHGPYINAASYQFGEDREKRDRPLPSSRVQILEIGGFLPQKVTASGTASQIKREKCAWLRRSSVMESPTRGAHKIAQQSF
jgi:hypothetical protein